MEHQTLIADPEVVLPVCQHIYPKGRHCRQAVSAPDSPYCTVHVRSRNRASTQLAAQLASKLKEVQSASDITEFLIGVINLLAENHIPARRAAVLTYIANSIRQSLRDEQREAASAEDSSPPQIDFGDLLKPFPAPDRSAVEENAHGYQAPGVPRGV
jgi:hypothetical protein